MIDNDTNTQSGTTTPDADPDAGWSDVPVDCDPDAGWGDQPVEPTGQLTTGGITDAGLDRMIAATVPKAEPRRDMNECALDLEAGVNALGWGDDQLALSVLNRGGVYIIPCPVCSRAGINTHLLQVRKSGENYTVKAVAAAVSGLG